MQQWKTSALLALLTVASLAQTASVSVLTPAVKRVGMRLACLCGGCKNSVGDCAMLNCHYAAPARERIARMVAEGMGDQQIVDVFVKERGLQALVAPPTEGFHLLAWVTPFAAMGMGLAAIWMFIRRFRRPVPAAEADPETLARYREQIEKDLSKFD